MGDRQSFPASVMPDIRYRASLFVFRMDPHYQFCGDDDWEANAHPEKPCRIIRRMPVIAMQRIGKMRGAS